jgi:F-type H+-transporting ATPase subunit c
MMKKSLSVLPALLPVLLVSTPAFAAEGDNLGAGMTMGLAVLGGALAQGMAAKGMYESVSRNPAAAGKLNAPFYVGLAFIESLCLFALVVSLQIAG